MDGDFVCQRSTDPVNRLLRTLLWSVPRAGGYQPCRNPDRGFWICHAGLNALHEAV